MRSLAAIKAAFLYQSYMEVVREGVHRGGANATAGGAADDQYLIHVPLEEVADQRCAKEDAGLLLLNDELARQRRDLLHDALADLSRGALRILGAAGVLVVPSA